MRRLRPGLWFLELGFRAPLDANAFLLDERDGPGDGDAVTLVDTGIRYNLRSLSAELATAGYVPADVDRVLLTHYDLDHTGGLDRHALDCPVYMGERDVALMRGEFTPASLHPKALFHRVVRHPFPVPARYDLRRVTDGDRVGRFVAFHTPGHNPGHTVYVHDSRVAFLGDLVWTTDGAFTTPFWLDSYDLGQLRGSLRSFVGRAPAFDVACVGHGDPVVGRADARLRAFVDGT